MVHTLHYLLLLWLGWGAATGAQGEPMQVIKVTESHTVLLSCSLDSASLSDSLNLTWLGPSEKEVLSVHVKSHRLKASLGSNWGLLIHSDPEDKRGWFTCSWNGISGSNHTLSSTRTPMRGDDNENIQEEVKDSVGGGFSSGQKDFPQPEGLASFPCDAPIPHNLTDWSLLWIEHDSDTQKEVLSATIRHDIPCLPLVRPNNIYLLLPSVTSSDAGNYTCLLENQSHHYQLEVMAKPEAGWLHFGDRHWIIWTVALGYVAACLGSIFGFLRLRHTIRTHRQQMKLRAPNRRLLQAKRKREHASNGILAPPANEDGKESVDAFSYENVLPNMGAQGGWQSHQTGSILLGTTTVEDEDEEEYECPDSETELKDDDDNYENTQEDENQIDELLSDESSYENSKEEMMSGSCTWVSADPWCSDNTQPGLENLTQDVFDEDGENYENVEEGGTLSPGAARLIAGLRLQLALDPQEDKEEEGSEASTGSQTYEEMNRTLSPSESKSLHLQPNTSNEEDADSYENMESPNSFNLRKEGTLDPCGEGTALGATRQNLSISFGVDLRGGLLCSE